MAIKVLFTLVIVCSVQRILGRDCSRMESISNCNECIRCGGFWCNAPIKGEARCAAAAAAAAGGWCPDAREPPRRAELASVAGDVVSPVRADVPAPVGAAATLPVVYTAGGQKTVEVAIVNTTQSANVSLTTSTSCAGDQCTLTLEATPGPEFCSSKGGLTEHVQLAVKLESLEEVSVRLHVPCACACSRHVELKSARCSHRGDYSCGVCACQSGWGGEYCEDRVCRSQRGDVQCTNPAKSDVDCSGNGHCGPCNTCECDTVSRGWQYLEPDSYCSDLCLTIATFCDHCLEEPRAGERCPRCNLNLKHLAFNETLVESRDEWNRSVWVKCEETLYNGCRVEYAAAQEGDETHVMVSSLCGDVTAAPVAATINLTLPVVLGAAAVVCAAAAAAGYAAWRARARPVPPADPRYQNIGAEDCVGENPLYKPPTSSYKNPTYGKW